MPSPDPTTPQTTVPSPYAEQLGAIPVRSAEVEVFGSTTRYWVYGSDDAAVTLVAVHGFRGDHHGLEPVVAFLGGVRVIAPDLPGFGESQAFTDREHSVASYAAWLEAFLDELGLGDDVVILGHSFGSIVTSAALASGVRASKLILVNPIAAPALKGRAASSRDWRSSTTGRVPPSRNAWARRSCGAASSRASRASPWRRRPRSRSSRGSTISTTPTSRCSRIAPWCSSRSRRPCRATCRPTRAGSRRRRFSSRPTETTSRRCRPSTSCRSCSRRPSSTSSTGSAISSTTRSHGRRRR
ncbi:alpha/beta fold hydrolase [Frondihabitans sucicola]|uniref:alpha/beta fold hydrolase n=1 Tax=Frondihabitans sucicola TaxID=1268041 RepID=UPI0033059013